MWPLISQGFGTHYFAKKEPDACHEKYTAYPNIFDQFMVSKSIALKETISVIFGGHIVGISLMIL
jgi:hypothetical protein